MTATQLRLLRGSAVMASCLLWGWGRACAEPVDGRVVRLAELAIDPAQLEEYKAALREEIETSIRVEPGVLTLYAVSVKGHADQIRLFETYRSSAAYQAHLQSAHFKRYKTRTQGMVKSLTLVETDPYSAWREAEMKFRVRVMKCVVRSITRDEDSFSQRDVHQRACCCISKATSSVTRASLIFERGSGCSMRSLMGSGRIG